MSNAISLHNTLSRRVEPLRTLEEGKVKIYTCGPTVYGHQHIGNYRTFIFEDVLVKTLRYFGYQVERVMNITDVGHLTSDADEGEDKMEVGANREGISAWEVAKKYEAAFLDDLALLNIEVPEKLIRATDTLGAQISFVKVLEELGFTYQTADGIYFDSTKVTDYGKLARLDVEGLQAGARVAMLTGKKHPTDFALWKFSPPGKKRDMEWPSPWGTGFPGWHLECSAIILSSLGEEIDIHSGGVDHIPVHHTNEIAQSESLTGKPLSRHWIHGEFLRLDGGKMAKSLGNLYTLSDLKERGIAPLAFRYYTYSALYRSKLNFTWEALESSQKNLERLYTHIHRLDLKSSQGEVFPYIERFERALADDLNLPKVMAILWEALRTSSLGGKEKRELVEKIEPVLSLNLLKSKQKEIDRIPEEIQHLANRRQEARVEKNWPQADLLRDEIEKNGFRIIDQDKPDQPYIIETL